jgi:hypothetical protein
MQLADFPRWLRGMFAVFLILFFFNAICALAFLTGILTTWRIDPGVATLIGAVLGLAIVAWQARLGFTNLIRSQEHRSEIETKARQHQYQLDLAREEHRTDEEKRILMAALRAEIVGLMQRAQQIEQTSRITQRLYEALTKAKAKTTVKPFMLPTFEAPVYQANVSKIGLLGTSLGADVVKVMTVTGVRAQMTFDVPMDHDMMATLYEGLADRMEEWQGELYHVAMRFRAVEEGTPDPGTLLERKQREAKKGATATPNS